MGCLNAKPADTSNSANTEKKQTSSGAGGAVLVMNKYHMFMNKADHMGEGTSSICRRGQNIETKQNVAIKVYKEQTSGSKASKMKSVTLMKFKRQIQVLQELQEPFKKPTDAKLWHSTLDSVKPEHVFMKLIDYSKDSKGEPGLDTTDNTMYVVTELAQYSLKDYLASLREKKNTLTDEKMKKFCKAILVAMAGLHAKGFVHIDMKPENMMMFSGKLKVIDVDGCVKMNSKINIQDSSISFSPCYCAPEWARFLISESESSIQALPGLDVWSVGMTLCELVTYDAILKAQYGNFLRNAHSHREAGFLFMEWLGGIKKVPLPKKVAQFNDKFADLIANWLVVCKKEQRKSCAQCLEHSFLADVDCEIEAHQIEHTAKIRKADDSQGEKIFKGTLFKLNSNGDATNNEHWIQRDMWIAQNHSLCYYSQKEGRKLVLIDGSKLGNATFEPLKNAARPHAFSCTVSEEQESDSIGLAAQDAASMDQWIQLLQVNGNNQAMITFHLGDKLAEDLKEWKIKVQNRRQKIDKDVGFEPVFKAKLWKLKTDGDSMKEADWFERDMWVAKNGSLVYFSPKDHTDLVYYSAQDVARAKLSSLGDGQTNKPFSFQVQLPANGDVEFAPGTFAAQDDDQRKEWIRYLGSFGHS
jgi:serine/threonine protein kinase